MATVDKTLTEPIPRVQRVRRRLTDGTVRFHFYHRPTGRRLPAPNNPEFAAAYEAAERQLASPAAKPERREGQHNEEQARNCENPSQGITPLVANRLPRAASAITSANTQTGLSPWVDPSDLLTPEELVARWKRKISLGTLKNWRSARTGVSYLRIGREIFYPLPFVKAWELQNLVRCQSPVPSAVTGGDDQEV